MTETVRARGRRCRTRVATCLAAGTLALVALAGCSTSKQPAAAPTTTTKTTVAPTTTTTALPGADQATAPAAAAALVSAWAAGNKLQALAVATPASVSTLFAVPYPGGLAIPRGCSDAFQPIVCTYGPPGGASPNDPIYEIDATQTPQGWYVSGVRIEN
jgi:hypothetical protein